MSYPYRVILTEEQRAELRGLVGSGVAPARMLTRARILLKADHGEGGPGWSDAAIAGALDVNPSTVLRVRRQFVREGLAATLARKRPDRVYERALDGHRKPTSSRSPVRRRRMGRTTGVSACWPTNSCGWRSWRRSPTRPCVRRSKKRPQAVAERAVVPGPDRRSRVRLAYGGRAGGLSAPDDPRRPVVCLDETSRQLLGEVRPPAAGGTGPAGPPRSRIRARRGRQPLPGDGTVAGLAYREVSNQRTRLDFAGASRSWSMSTIRALSGSSWSSTNSIPTRPPRSTRPFRLHEAKRLADKLEIHYTPNMAPGSTWPNSN